MASNKTIESIPVYSANRLSFTRRDYTEKEKDILKKYTAKINNVEIDEEEVKLTYAKSLGKIRTKQQLLILESYIQGAKDAKSGLINLFDIDELDELYAESKADIDSKEDRQSTVDSYSLQGEFTQPEGDQ